MTLTRWIAAATLAATAGVCAAQGTASSPAKKELVQKVLALQRQGLETMGNTLVAQLGQQMLQKAGPAVARVAPDKREALANELKAEVRKFYEEATPAVREQAVKLGPSMIAGPLEEKFSEDELKTLVAWLESPVNRKFQQFAGELQQQMQQKLVAETRTALEAKLKALEQVMTKKLTDAGAPLATRGASAPPAASKK
jgi:uncharacterized protein